MARMLILLSRFLKYFSRKRTVSTEKKVVFYICSFFLLLIEDIRKVFYQILNKLNIKSAGILRFKKLTLLTGNLKKVFKPIFYYNSADALI